MAPESGEVSEDSGTGICEAAALALLLLQKPLAEQTVAGGRYDRATSEGLELC